MASRPLLLLLLFVVLSSLLVLSYSTAEVKVNNVDDDDLAFLETDTDSETDTKHAHGDDDDFNEYENYNDEDFEDFDEEEFGDSHDGVEKFDESDVVVLTDKNFSEVVEKRRFVMVEFYAPWCGHCQALAPEYAAAATELKGEDVVLAKVDATEESELAERFDVQGFPTVLFFVDGAHRDYPGTRRKDGIVTWIKKKIGPGVENVTTVEEAEKIIASESKVVLGFFDSLVGPDSHEFAAASKLEDGVSFYQTVNPDVAKLFHIDSDVKRPALVLVKNEDEKLAYFEGQFSKSAIADFVFANKLPLVTIFTKESAPEVFENPIKKQILLFTVSSDTDKILPAFKEAAKFFKGKLIFVYVERDNEDVGKPVSEYFGVPEDLGPKVLAYTGNEDAKKFILSGEVTADNVKKFAEGFLEDKLKPFYKSDPIPEKNDGDVKIVVGDNFDEIVLDESKDVLLEIYAPWCGHCQALEPTYNKLGKHLRDIESLVIAKMDGTTNEHPRAKTDGFPTLLFFPAGNKSFEPITVDTDRTVVAFYKFLKKHASIPFKLQRPATSKNEAADASTPKTETSPSAEVKDEL